MSAQLGTDPGCRDSGWTGHSDKAARSSREYKAKRRATMLGKETTGKVGPGMEYGSTNTRDRLQGSPDPERTANIVLLTHQPTNRLCWILGRRRPRMTRTTEVGQVRTHANGSRLLGQWTQSGKTTDSRKDGNPDPPGNAGLARVAQR